jgi:hypothetical protein
MSGVLSNIKGECLLTFKEKTIKDHKLKQELKESIH